MENVAISGNLRKTEFEKLEEFGKLRNGTERKIKSEKTKSKFQNKILYFLVFPFFEWKKSPPRERRGAGESLVPPVSPAGNNTGAVTVTDPVGGVYATREPISVTLG